MVPVASGSLQSGISCTPLGFDLSIRGLAKT
jgi:hypothetical protein